MLGNKRQSFFSFSFFFHFFLTIKNKFQDKAVLPGYTLQLSLSFFLSAPWKTTWEQEKLSLFLFRIKNHFLSWRRSMWNGKTKPGMWLWLPCVALSLATSLNSTGWNDQKVSLCVELFTIDVFMQKFTRSSPESALSIGSLLGQFCFVFHTLFPFLLLFFPSLVCFCHSWFWFSYDFKTSLNFWDLNCLLYCSNSLVVSVVIAVLAIDFIHNIILWPLIHFAQKN